MATTAMWGLQSSLATDLGLKASCSEQCTRGLSELKSGVGRRSVQASSGPFLGPLAASSRWNSAEEDEPQQFGGKPAVIAVRNPSEHTKVRCCGVRGGLLDLHTPNFPIRATASSTNDLHKLRVLRARASVEDGVQSTEVPASSDETRTSAATSDPPTSESPPPSTPNPFAAGKISRIASKQTGNGDSKSPVAQKAAIPKKPAAVKTPPAGQLSANAAAQLKVSRQPSVFTVPTKPTDEKPSSPFSQSGPSSTKPSSPFAPTGQSKPTAPVNPFRKDPLVPADWEKAGARPAGSGKRVLEAFKEGDKAGKSTKFGQPVVPTNIFDEVRRTPEEIAADAFKFEINSGQLLLAASFVVVVAIMLGTVFLVWKVGAIHYNEY